MTKFLSRIGSFFTRIIKSPIRETHALGGKCKRILMQLKKSSIISSENDLFTASSLPNKLIDKALETFQPQSILDLGCGTGQAVSYFLSQGITDIIGIEGSTVAIAKSKVSNYLMQFDLNQELNLGRKFDLIFSYEFVEHIHPNYLDNLLKSFSNHSDISWDNLMEDGSIESGEDNIDRKVELIQGNQLSVQNTLLKGCWWHISGCAIRLKIFEDVGGFAIDMPQQGDWEWLLRLLSKGWAVEYIPRTLILYRQHSASVSSVSYRTHRDIRESLRIFHQYQGFLSTQNYITLHLQIKIYHEHKLFIN